MPDPVRCCEALEGLPYRLFLDSASTASRLGRYSFLTADPVALVRSRGAEAECLDRLTGARRAITGDPLTAMRELITPYTAESFLTCHLFKAVLPVTSPTTGASRSSVCPRRAMTTSACPIWYWASTTG